MATVEPTNLDDRLYDALVARAAQENRSVREEVEAILQESLATPSSSPQDVKAANLAFMELVGSWQDSRTAEEIVVDINSSDMPPARSRRVHAT
jgi:plasmid stability protein